MKHIPLLDLGNVVVQVNFAPFLQFIADRAGHGDASRITGLLHSSLFFDFEFGQLKRADFSDRVAALYGAQFTLPELEAAFCSIFSGLVDGMEELLTELAAEGPVYCLSNTNEIHLEYCRRHFPVLEKFTRVFASHEMGRRKPYPGIYIDVAKSLNVDPRTLVFFDDSHANVQGALKAGLEAHVFSSAAVMREILKGSHKEDDKEL